MAVTNRSLFYSTEEILKKFKPSLTNYFNVYINATWGSVTSDDINFYAYEAVLPGTSFETTQIFGDRQGITETFANKRVYPPVDVSFYVDYDYKVLDFFENWISSICPDGGRFNKFNYPSGLKKDVQITKFEREFRSPGDRISSRGSAGSPAEPKQVIYTLQNAYPTNLISLPVSYDNTSLLRTTVTFNYDSYIYNNKQGSVIGGRPSASAGTDPAPAAAPAAGILPGSLLDSNTPLGKAADQLLGPFNPGITINDFTQNK